jgi:hypothetical protein
LHTILILHPEKKNARSIMKTLAGADPINRQEGEICLVITDIETGEAFFELRELTAAVEQTMNTSPSRMAFRIDVKLQNVARIAPGRFGGEAAAVRHLNGDFMVIGMDVFFHRLSLRNLKRGV